MRVLLFLVAFSFPNTETGLVTFAALILLALSIAAVILLELSKLVYLIWKLFKNGVREVLDFWDEIRERRQT